MPADTLLAQDHVLPSGLARGAPPFDKDRSSAVGLLLRTRQTRFFFQKAPCLAPRNFLLPVKAMKWLLYSPKIPISDLRCRNRSISNSASEVVTDVPHRSAEVWSPGAFVPGSLPPLPHPWSNPKCPLLVGKKSPDNPPEG